MKNEQNLLESSIFEKRQRFNCQLSIYDLPSDVLAGECEGSDVLFRIPRVELLTAYGTVDLAVEAMKEGADDFLTKPVDLDQLEMRVKKVLELVYVAMTEKGYNPVNQIVGYIISGDPTYITSHKNARSMIMKVERDEIVEELLKEYIRNEAWKRRS